MQRLQQALEARPGAAFVGYNSGGEAPITARSLNVMRAKKASNTYTASAITY